MSREEFADRVGFTAAFCDVIEGHPDGLALWPLEAALLLAQEFDIDALSLVERLVATEE
jgi:hypothetical protein